METEARDLGGLGLVVRIVDHIFYWQSTANRQYWYRSTDSTKFIINDFGDLVGV